MQPVQLFNVIVICPDHRYKQGKGIFLWLLASRTGKIHERKETPYGMQKLIKWKK